MQLTTQSGGQNRVFTNAMMTQGESIVFSLTLTNSDTNLPLDITGWRFKSRLAFPRPHDFTTENSAIVITNATLGAVQYTIPSNITAGFPTGVFPWDVWAVTNTAAEYPLVQGRWTVNPSISPVP